MSPEGQLRAKEAGRLGGKRRMRVRGCFHPRAQNLMLPKGIMAVNRRLPVRARKRILMRRQETVFLAMVSPRSPVSG